MQVFDRFMSSDCGTCIYYVYLDLQFIHFYGVFFPAVRRTCIEEKIYPKKMTGPSKDNSSFSNDQIQVYTSNAVLILYHQITRHKS